MDLCPVCPEQILLLLGLLVLHDTDELVPLDRRCHGEPDARVSRCGLDNGVAWRQPTVDLSTLDHAKSDPVLDGTAGVHGLDLGDKVAVGVYPRETDERRVPHCCDD